MPNVVPATEFLFSIGAAIGSLSANKCYNQSNKNNNPIFSFTGICSILGVYL